MTASLYQSGSVRGPGAAATGSTWPSPPLTGGAVRAAPRGRGVVRAFESAKLSVLRASVVVLEVALGAGPAHHLEHVGGGHARVELDVVARPVPVVPAA